MSRLTIVCIEGCHGSGKTHVLHSLKDAGHHVIDEGFLDMPDMALTPQSFTMELVWVAEWFRRVLMIYKAETCCVGARDKTIYADRSPYSALFYAPRGDLMRETIKQAIAELEGVNIIIKTVYVKVDDAILWGRIQRRLAADPSRAKYNEGSRQWMDQTVKFYEDNKDLWDHTVENNDGSTRDVVAARILQLK
jgi:thymidylate kinase